MTEDTARVLILNDDSLRIVDKATFDKLAVPLSSLAEQGAPPNIRFCAMILDQAGYAIMKKETAKKLLLAHQAIKSK